MGGGSFFLVLLFNFFFNFYFLRPKREVFRNGDKT